MPSSQASPDAVSTASASRSKPFDHFRDLAGGFFSVSKKELDARIAEEKAERQAERERKRQARKEKQK